MPLHKTPRLEAKFVQLAVAVDELFALDQDGNVWKYHPAQLRQGGHHYAFWGALTTHRADPNA